MESFGREVECDMSSQILEDEWKRFQEHERKVRILQKIAREIKKSPCYQCVNQGFFGRVGEVEEHAYCDHASTYPECKDTIWKGCWNNPKKEIKRHNLEVFVDHYNLCLGWREVKKRSKKE